MNKSTNKNDKKDNRDNKLCSMWFKATLPKPIVEGGFWVLFS